MAEAFILKKEDWEAGHKIYSNIREMVDLKTKVLPHFSGPDGDRSFMGYIDGSERILNGHTLSREGQGKESWQSNMMDNVTRAKLRAIVAGVGLKVPNSNFTAMNKNGLSSSVRADIFKNITEQSFRDGNPIMHSFLEVWQLMAHGVLFEHEGYKTGGIKQKRVKSFDSVTGEVEVVSEYVKMDGKPYSVILNPQEFYWWDFYVRDLQEQPRIAWIQHYTKRELEMEFSKYPNFKHVIDKKTATRFQQLQESSFFKQWGSRVSKEDDYEVVRYYSLDEDVYEIWVNGVPILRAPMLWGEKEKYYPFAKTIAEPFANTNFFVGMSLAGILEAYQETKNTVINTMIDKLYRSMETPMLVGLMNRDLLDVESELVNQDNRYYVPDVNQVKPMPIPGINQGELAMLQVLDRGIETLSVDRAQQGQQSAGNKTATEVQVANTRAQELKSILFIAREDLWLQKTRLRVENILTHFLKDKAAREDMRDQIITVKDYCFYNGDRGTLDIHIADTKKDLLPVSEIEAREQAAEQDGQVYKLISITKDYLDNWKYDFSVISETLHNQDKAQMEADTMSEIQRVITLFPEFFVANKDTYLRDVLEIYGKHPDEYNKPAPPPPPMPMGQPPEEGEPAGAVKSPLEQGAQMLQ